MDIKDVTRASDFDSDSAKKYLADCYSMDQDRHRYAMDVIEKFVNRESRLRKLSFELEDQKASRCRYQQEAKELATTLDNLNRRITRGAFVVVLVDGDGATFVNELLQSQESGGAKAACRLTEAVRQYLGEIHPELSEEEIPVIVKIWANLEGLAGALCDHGSIRTKREMLSFAEDFSKSRAEFDFVNVGRGKENADNKMRKMLNFYFNNIQCKKIIFAGCHDTGYIHDLQEKQGNEDARQRLVLLETTTAEPQFRKLGFPITRFDTVFRREKLGVRGNEPRVNAFDRCQTSALQTLVNSAPTRSVSPPLPEPSMNPTMPKGEQEVQTYRSLDNVIVSDNGGTSINYATIGGNTDHANIVIAAANHKEKRYILYNAAGARLDPPNTRSWESATQSSYNLKMERIKPKIFCNDFYLMGHCAWGLSCVKEHNQALTRQEIAIHRYRARTGPCTDGPSCRRFGCYSSHHCPGGKHCRKGPDCVFSSTYHGNVHLLGMAEQKPALKLVEGEEKLKTI